MADRFKLISAVHLMLIKDNKILLLRRCNTGYEDGNYSVVAGHIDGNEEIKTAMIREAQEEAGIIINENDIEIVGVMHRKSTDERIDFFLKCEKWGNEITNMEPNKCDELKWVDINALPDNVIPYIKKSIENYLDNIMFDSYGW